MSQVRIEEREPEWEAPNTVKVTTMRCLDKTYTVSTCRLSGSSFPLGIGLITAIGDMVTGNEDETEKDYETMLFVDGESTGEDVYPFGDLPGNKL